MRCVIRAGAVLVVASVFATCGGGITVRQVPESSAQVSVAAEEPAPRATPAVAEESTALLSQAPASVNFDSEVLPILETRCRPCHFPGGKMYERLPFDRPETIHELGTRLFTRLEDPGDQAVIRVFLGIATE
jgi:hypothetical protein